MLSHFSIDFDIIAILAIDFTSIQKPSGIVADVEHEITSMMFCFRAVFWIAVVAFFMPGDPAADALAGTARSAAEKATAAAENGAYAAVADVCLDSPDLCTASVNAVDDVQALAVQGLDALASALDESDASASN